MKAMTCRFDCKHCGQMIEADASVAGKTIASPWCDNPLQLRNAMRQPRKPNKLLLLLCLTLVGAMAFGLFKLGISFSNEGASPDQALDKKDGRLSFTTNGKDVDIPQRTLRELATAMYNTMFPKSLVGTEPAAQAGCLGWPARHEREPSHGVNRLDGVLPETWLLASALGALVGLNMAMTGAGGGVLAVPLLIFGLGLTVHQAAPVALLAVGAAAGIGALLGLKEGIVRYRAAGLIGGVAMLMAPLGVWLAHRVSQAPLLLGFSAVLAWTAWRMAGLRAPRLAGRPEPPRRVHPCQVNPGEGRLRWTAPCAWVLAGTGLASGLLTGLFI